MNTQSEINQKMMEFEEKYELLVWYARKSEHQINTIPAVRECVLEVQTSYPHECQELNEYRDWAHGFNSGMLASVRYLLEMERSGVDCADKNFPSLDT